MESGSAVGVRRSRLEHLDALMVVDRNNRYTGVLWLTDLASLETHRRVSEAMDSTVAAVPATMPAARVARLFQDRDLVSAAVIDERGRLIGRITVDDVVDVIGERAEEAALAPAGLEAGGDLFAPVLTSAKRRIVWLGVHLIGAFMAAWVIGLFAASIEQLVALAILMPVVAAMGGVAGSQTQTLVTRGIALERVGRTNAPRLLRNELGVSLANGTFWAVVVAIVASLWFGNLVLAVVFGAALASPARRRVRRDARPARAEPLRVRPRARQRRSGDGFYGHRRLPGVSLAGDAVRRVTWSGIHARGLF